MSTAMTAIRSREALSWAAVDLMVCSEYLIPPAKKHLTISSRKWVESDIEE